MNIINVSPAQLRRAADIQERIVTLQKELGQILGEAPAASAPAAPAGGGRGKISAAGLARIRAAQRLRWAKARAAQGAGKPAAKAKKTHLSPEGRARIIAAAKARWAKVRAARR
jgi:hypothetical protein